MMKKRGKKQGFSEPVILCISGMAGSGKSTVARRIAKKYGLKYYSGGDALKALAKEEGYEFVEHGWWETLEGMRFLERRTKDPRFDKAVDQKLLELAKHGNVVLDSWTMPWLIDKAFKVWLETSPKKRAERIARRDRMRIAEAVDALSKKEKRTKEIYKNLYGFSLGEDFAPFHLILDTTDLRADEVFQVLCNVLDNMVIRSRSVNE